MGDIKKQKKKFKRPSHPWQKARIEEEKIILRDYGLKNKKEIWRFGTKLKTFKTQAKNLIASDKPNDEVLRTQLLSRLHRLGFLSKDVNSLDEVLSLNLSSLLDRRLQTRLIKLGFARSAKQSRQFITHGHVFSGGRKVTAPSYIVPVDETIEFDTKSSLSAEDHPERALPEPKVEVKEESKEESKEKPKEAPKKAKEAPKAKPKEEPKAKPPETKVEKSEEKPAVAKEEKPVEAKEAKNE